MKTNSTNLTPSLPPLPMAIQKWISTEIGPDWSLIPLAGDGSPRPFYRLKSGAQSFVFLYEPSWMLSRDYPIHQAYLKKKGLPVPEFKACDPKLGTLLMEDLGDVLLQQGLEEKYLLEASELLAKLHGSTFPVPKELPVATRFFDSQKYFEEFSFTKEHLHEKFLGLSKPLDIEKIQGFCAFLEKIQPQVFCHRDYHTRNILLHKKKLYLIDFQDARMGPPHYDLASLLYDPYVPLEKVQQEKIFRVYQKEIAQYSLPIDWNKWHEQVAWVGFQRMVKAAGSFASFMTRFQKDTHLKYLLPALKTAQALEKHLPKAHQNIFPLKMWMERILNENQKA